MNLFKRGPAQLTRVSLGTSTHLCLCPLQAHLKPVPQRVEIAPLEQAEVRSVQVTGLFQYVAVGVVFDPRATVAREHVAGAG